MSFSQFKHDAVRDLAWAVFSPPLLPSEHPSARGVASGMDVNRPIVLRWLQQLDQHPEPLQHYLNGAKTHFLGLYFEALWQYFLSHAPGFCLMDHNLTVMEGKRTVGELDAVYQYDHHSYHLELAVKFYLCMPQQPSEVPLGGELEHWLGPGCKDRLDLKVHRLYHHQLLLSDHPWVKKKYPNTLIKQLVVKGVLFTQLGVANAPWPTAVHRGVSQGQWLYLKQLELLDQVGHGFYVLAKKQWLCPPSENTIYVHFTELRGHLNAHFQQSQFPVQLIKNHQGHLTRYFVVPDHWPFAFTANLPTRS